MSILVKNFNESKVIKFKEEYYTALMSIGSIGAILLFLGIIFETLTIASILRVRQKSVDTLFVLSLCCADLIYNLYQITSNMIVLSAGGWSVGQKGCLVSCAMILGTLGISILSITLLTLNRYMAIIWKVNITRTQALVMIGAIWIILCLIVVLYLSSKELSENSISLQPSYFYCLLDFSSNDPIVITALITVLVFLALPIFFLSYAYSKIFIFYRAMNRKKKKDRSAIYQSERKLLVKSIAITSAFVVTYSFELIIRLYEFSSKSSIHPVVDLIGAIGICSNTLLNSIILLAYDGLVQTSALELLGLEKWWRKSVRVLDVAHQTPENDIKLEKKPELGQIMRGEILPAAVNDGGNRQNPNSMVATQIINH